MRYEASNVVPADPETIHGVLTDLSRLASWNPAFSNVAATGWAACDQEYVAVVRGIAKATLTFNKLDVGDVRYTLRGLGSVERGSWLSRAAAGGTEVTHSFEHSGLLLMLMHSAFVQVPEWRLGRLRAQALGTPSM